MPRLSRLTYSLTACLFCFGLVLFVFGPCLTEMAETFRVPLGRLGLLWSFYALGLTPAVACTGYLSGRLGRRRLLLWSTALMGLSCWFFGASPSIGARPNVWMLMSAMTCLGVAGGVLQTIVNAAVADENRPSSGFALNLALTLFAVGAVIGPASVSASLQAGLPWPVAFYALGACFFVLLIVLLPQPIPEGGDEPLTLTLTRQLLRAPMLWALIGITSLYVGAESGLVTWISPFLERELGASRALAGLAVSVFWAAMLVGRALTTVAVLRFPLEPLMAVLGLGAAAATAAEILSPSAAAGLAGAAGAGLFMSGMTPLTLTDVSRHFEEHRSAVYGLVLTGIGAGSVLVPAAMGVVADASQIRHALALPPVLLASVGVIYLVRGRRLRAGAALEEQKVES